MFRIDLHESGYIEDPPSKAKSVLLTDEGVRRSKALFEKHFAKQSCESNAILQHTTPSSGEGHFERYRLVASIENTRYLWGRDSGGTILLSR
jgi:Domain of unknown function (DUF6429)